LKIAPACCGTLSLPSGKSGRSSCRCWWGSRRPIGLRGDGILSSRWSWYGSCCHWELI